jgi:hypothetical protein
MNLKIIPSVLRAVSVASLFALSGCVKVNMPDHMVADAVDAGKDLYDSVERAFRREPKLEQVESNSAGSEFRLAKAGSTEVPVSELERSCMSTLLAETKLKVGNDRFEYRVIDQRVEAKESGVVVLCHIAIAKPQTDG